MANENTETPASDVGAAPQTSDDYSLVLDVPMTVQVQLGEATLTIAEILKCGKGSVIPLNQKIGEPFVIKLHQKPIAMGEIVEAGDQLGIKITSILKVH